MIVRISGGVSTSPLRYAVGIRSISCRVHETEQIQIWAVHLGLPASVSGHLISTLSHSIFLNRLSLRTPTYEFRASPSITSHSRFIRRQCYGLFWLLYIFLPRRVHCLQGTAPSATVRGSWNRTHGRCPTSQGDRVGLIKKPAQCPRPVFQCGHTTRAH